MEDADGKSESQKKVRASELLPQVYAELRKLAQYKMKNEGGFQTLSATALVHEAYLRISKSDELPIWSSKRQFFSAAAEAMRRILIDRARTKKRIKRGGRVEWEDYFESQILASVKDDEILAVDEALEELDQADPESAELVKLRYFIGMSWEEISEATGIPDRTLRRRWTYAKTWLKERIERN
tara:strand:+ start:118 stop:666 length:549 start_codon:yes stop_codon:yes gene_type:complete